MIIPLHLYGLKVFFMSVMCNVVQITLMQVNSLKVKDFSTESKISQTPPSQDKLL